MDELFTHADPDSAEAKAVVREKSVSTYFPQSVQLVKDLETSFKLWDAVYAGVSSSGKLLDEKEKKKWNEVNVWLSTKR